MSDFDLRTLVGEVLAETNLTEPADIAAEVARRTPKVHLRAAYETALTGYVRVINNAHRRENTILKPRPASRSAKVSAIRDQWQAALRDRVHTGDGWKLLGECTYSDLMAAAKRRRELADRNLAMADRYEALAQQLLAAGVDRVADLPDGIVEGEAAA